MVSESVFPTMKSIGADKQENKASKSNEAEKCDQIATKEEKIDFSNVCLLYTSPSPRD